jgi:hypothetical protein
MIQDLSILTPEKGSEAKVFVQNIIASLFFKIKECYEIDSSYLSEYHKGVMYKSLVLLNQSSERSLASDVTKNKTEIIEQLDFVDDNYYESRLSVFLRSLDCEEIENFIMTENEKFIDTLEALPKKGTSSLHFDRVIEKIISHLARRLDQSRSNLSQTAVWVIQSFRVMIERAWGMSIFDRDSEGGEEQDLASKNIVLSLNACGATSLCLDILACGSEVLNLEAIQLCVAMLFKEGGAKEIQETIYDHLSSSRSSDIFLSVQRIILELKDWFKWNMSNDDDSNQLNPPRLLITLRFLQLMCEGHYLNNQDIMRDQGKSVTVNLLADFVEFLALLSKNPNKQSMEASLELMALILEVIQGPCHGNQSYFVMNSELIETLNRLMRIKLKIEDIGLEVEMKKSVIDIFQALLEGQGFGSAIYERVLSVLHLDVLRLICFTALADNDSNADGIEAMESLQTECLVLFQMLLDFKPSLKQALNFPGKSMPNGIVSIEVLWHSDLQRRFFNVPTICHQTAKSSMDYLVEFVNRSNQEEKLLDFVSLSRSLYREVKHQNDLNNANLSIIFNNSNKYYTSWVTFLSVLVINAIFLFARTGQNFDAALETSLFVIRILIFLGSFAVMLFTIVLQIPLKYKSLIDLNEPSSSVTSSVTSILECLLEPSFLYSSLFCSLCALGMMGNWIKKFPFSDVWFPFLLLDIVAKNSTTRDVLNAIVYPWKQLGMTLLLGAFILYIFAFLLV